MSDLSRLLVKAVRQLPPEEQDAVLEALVEPKLAPFPDPGAVRLPFPHLVSAELQAEVGHPRLLDPRIDLAAPPIGPETGGPWQSVPVRLSTDQHERLKQWCQTNGFTMAVVLRGLVARFLDDQAARQTRPPEEGPSGQVAGQGAPAS